MAKQVMDIRPGKGMTLSQSNEHLRIASRGAYVANLSGNFDPTRERLNFEVTKGGIVTPLDKSRSIPMRIGESLRKRFIMDPNIGLEVPIYRTVANIIIGGSRVQMRRLAFGDQKIDWEKKADNSRIVRHPEIEKWAVDMYNFMTNRYGEDNVAAFIVHLDETNPHIHCTLLPVTPKNKISYNYHFGGMKDEGRKKFLALHDELAKINAEYGLERGEDIQRTGAKHRTTAQYRQEMSEKLRDENMALARSNVGIKQENERLSLNNRKLEVSIIHASARLKSLKTMIDHLETRHSDLQKEVADLEEKYSKGQIAKEEYDKNLAKLQESIAELEVKLADKRESEKIAQEKLDDILSKVSKGEEKLSENKQKLSDVKQELRETVPKRDMMVMDKMQATAFASTCVGMKERLRDFNENLSKLTPQQRMFVENVISPLFDDRSVDLNLKELAEDGADIMNISTSLFLGYLDNATKISQGGGGGGGPTSGWGKRDDEDDFTFMRRCFHMAKAMKRGGRSGGRRR